LYSVARSSRASSTFLILCLVARDLCASLIADCCACFSSRLPSCFFLLCISPIEAVLGCHKEPGTLHFIHILGTCHPSLLGLSRDRRVKLPLSLESNLCALEIRYFPRYKWRHTPRAKMSNILSQFYLRQSSIRFPRDSPLLEEAVAAGETTTAAFTDCEFLLNPTELHSLPMIPANNNTPCHL
jgi:hypothetical protein